MRWVDSTWNVILRVLGRMRPGTGRPPEGIRQERPHDRPWILALVPEGPNRSVLETTSENAGWALTLSDSTIGNTGLLPYRVPAIVIYDRELSPDHWPEMIHAFARKSPRPYIILLSPSSDANLWDELQRAGGSEILRTPMNRDRLLWALVKAWQLWRAQQRVRPSITALTR